jgi:hypothetical protein
MSDQNCETCGKKLTAWNHAWGTKKCSRCAKEGIDYVTLPDGRRRYLKALGGDIAIAILLPGIGLLMGAWVFFAKHEKRRGGTMMIIGGIILFLIIISGRF